MKRKYSDGGKVEKPTYMGAVKDRALEMIGRGPNVPKRKQIDISGSGRRKQTDDAVDRAVRGYRDGGKVVKNHKC